MKGVGRGKPITAISEAITVANEHAINQLVIYVHSLLDKKWPLRHENPLSPAEHDVNADGIGCCGITEGARIGPIVNNRCVDWDAAAFDVISSADHKISGVCQMIQYSIAVVGSSSRCQAKPIVFLRDY